MSMFASKLAAAQQLDLSAGAISTALRIHLWCYTLVMVETAVVFPFLLNAYGTEDYPKPVLPYMRYPVEEAVPMVERREEESQYVSFPDAARLEGTSCTPNGDCEV